MNIGTILRKHRKENKQTLKDIASKAGISEGFLSQVENNVNSPSVDTLINICNVIGINAGDVLNQIENQEKCSVIRKQDWNDIDIPVSGFATHRFIRPENRSIIDSAIIVIEPGKTIPVRKNIKNAQEVLCVLQGQIKFVHGNSAFVLSIGDSVHLWTIPEKQLISNSGKKRAIVLWVGTI